MAITIPYTFSTLTTISSTEVNGNFTAMLNALDKRGDTLTGNLLVSAGITIDGVDISAVLGAGGTLPAVDGSLVTALNATQLTSGTIPDARFPATLPALSGANLTALDASDLASGTVPPARLGSGTPSSSTYLRGDSAWVAGVAAGGADTQVQFNDGGSAFNGDAGLTYNKTTDTLTALNLVFTQTLVSGNVITPTTLSANQDNYAPTGFATATHLRLETSGGARTITGIAGGSAGRIITLTNLGAGGSSILIAALDGGSSGANQFANAITIAVTQSVMFWYDGSAGLWRGLR